MQRICLKRKQALKRLIERMEQRLDRLQRHSHRLSLFRLWVFLISLALFWGMGALNLDHFKIGILAIGFLLFGLLVVIHCRIRAKISIYRAYLKIKKGQQAQMTLDWNHLLHTASDKMQGTDSVDLDLNLSGPKSLHHLINFTISFEGGHLLKQWLLAPEPQLKTVKRRQKIVKELLCDQRFRERLLLAFFKSKDKQLDGQKLLNWLDQTLLTADLKYYLIISIILCFCGWTLFCLSFFGIIPAYWMPCLLIYFSLYLIKTPQIQQAVEDVQKLDDELVKLKPVLRFIENYSYGKLPYTSELCRCFLQPKNKPTTQLKAVKLYTTAVGLRMNPVLAILLNGAVPWDLLLTYLIERQKQALKMEMPVWMNTFYELEALISLANFAYVKPHYTFPGLEDYGIRKNAFSAFNIGHPLISELKKVRNDFTFKDMGQVVLITGSNMTGKSTFLKTLGTNLKLAYTGGPVDAAKMSIPLFRVITSIRIADSLAQEVSYFYAEVKRLKQILTALEESNGLPVFFLVDEILKGTNNLERFLGSSPFIKAVCGKHGVGLITTHDLSLCKLAENNPLILNHHFKDDVQHGRFAFDYKLRLGASTSTNALKILESEGLPLDES